MEEVVADTGSESREPGQPVSGDLRRLKSATSRKLAAAPPCGATEARMETFSLLLASESLRCASDFEPAVGDGL